MSKYNDWRAHQIPNCNAKLLFYMIILHIKKDDTVTDTVIR